jgi:hypothetical protein
VLSGNETLLANHISGFDGLRIEVQRLARLFRSQNQIPAEQTSTAVMRNLQQCVQSAEQFVSSASSILGSRTTILSGSEAGITINDAQRTRITNWIPELPASTIDENVDYNTFATSSTFSEIDAFTDDTVTVYRGAQTTRQSTVSGITEEPPEGPYPGIEMHLIQYWKKTAKTHFDAGDYAAAEKHLQKVITRSEALEGQQFENRSEMLQMLALSLSRQEKWDPARRILMDLWNHPAETRDTNARSLQRVRLRHDIAAVYFGLKDYANAEQWCHKAANERMAMVGMKDPSVYESVFMLREIYRLRGDTEEAEAYCALLPSEHVGKFPPYSCHNVKKFSIALNIKRSRNYVE